MRVVVMLVGVVAWFVVWCCVVLGVLAVLVLRPSSRRDEAARMRAHLRRAYPETEGWS